MPAIQERTPWWQRIRGARAITWQSVLGGNGLITVVILASGGTLGGYTPGPGAVSRSVVAVLAAGAVAAAWAMVGFFVLMRNRRTTPVSLWAYFTYYAINGAIYFAAVQWLDAMSEESSGIGWPARLVSSAAISVAWGVAVSLLLESSDRFHAQRNDLLDDMVDAEVRLLRESQEVERLKAALDSHVDEALAATRAQLSTVLGTAGVPATVITSGQAEIAADLVRSAASDVVRPLSHRLHELANESFPSPRFSGVVQYWWKHPRLPALATALLVSSQTTAESVRNFGGVAGPIVSLFYFAGLYLFLLAVTRIAKRFPHLERVMYLVGVVGSITLNVVFAEGPSPEPWSTGDAAANAVASLAYIAITSLFAATVGARDALLTSLQSEVRTEELRSRAMQRETVLAVDTIARELHGRVQSQLVVCAAELERASVAGDHDAVLRAVSEAASALDSATKPSQPTLFDVVGAWESVLNVQIDAPESLASVMSRADVVAVVEEGLANAYRHGNASEAFVSLRMMSDCLRIVVTDDGRGITHESEGFGSRLLRQLSNDRTHLASEPQGTVLTVDLPRDYAGGSPRS